MENERRNPELLTALKLIPEGLSRSQEDLFFRARQIDEVGAVDNSQLDFGPPKFTTVAFDFRLR
jgi:hypothetical protein